MRTSQIERLQAVRAKRDGAKVKSLLDDRGKPMKEAGPGMPVEVFIQTRERTPLNYLVKPISDYFERALNEE